MPDTILESLCFFIPAKPVAHARPRVATRGRGGRPLPFARTYYPKKTRDAREMLAWEARRHADPGMPWAGPIELVLEIRRHRRKKAERYWIWRPDFDNFAKLTDSFNGIFWLDDAQVVDGCVRKILVDKNQPEGYHFEIRLLKED